MNILRIFLTESDQNIQFRRIVISLNFEFLTSLKCHKMLPPTSNIIGTFNALKKRGGEETCHTFLSLLSVIQKSFQKFPNRYLCFIGQNKQCHTVTSYCKDGKMSNQLFQALQWWQVTYIIGADNTYANTSTYNHKYEQ